MTLYATFPIKNIDFPWIGTVKLNPTSLEKKFFSVLSDNPLPELPAVLFLGLNYAISAVGGVLSHPYVAIPLSLSNLSNSVYIAQSPESSTALAIIQVAFSSLVFGAVCKLAYHGSLKDFSDYSFEIAKTSKTHYNTLTDNEYTHLQLSEAPSVKVSNQWPHFIKAPIDFFNNVISKVYSLLLQLLSKLRLGTSLK